LGAGPPAIGGQALAVGDASELLVAEATALLELARRRRPIDTARAERFARAVIESTPLGASALGVLDGGVLAGARLVELAGAVLVVLGAGCERDRRRKCDVWSD
jgi:hypothetical protein